MSTGVVGVGRGFQLPSDASLCYIKRCVCVMCVGGWVGWGVGCTSMCSHSSACVCMHVDCRCVQSHLHTPPYTPHTHTPHAPHPTPHTPRPTHLTSYLPPTITTSLPPHPTPTPAMTAPGASAPPCTTPLDCNAYKSLATDDVVEGGSLAPMYLWRRGGCSEGVMVLCCM